MLRSFFFVSLLALTLLLTACPADTNPPACTGASCPQPCKNVAAAEFKSSTFTATTSTAPFQNCYVRGSTHTVAINLTPKATANLNGEQAIIVVDVVRNDAAKTYPTVLASMFNRNTFTVNPDIFSKPLAISQIKTGIKANVTFTLLNNAPTGDLVFVISAFRGTNATEAANLIGRAFYYFKVE
jgi:hypothetical protein